MSKIQGKPFIESVLGELTEEQMSSLMSLINGTNKTPAFRSLINSSNFITNADEGVKHVVLETYNKTYTGYLVYTTHYCVLISYLNHTQELTMLELNLTNKTYKIVKEPLTITELRFELGGVGGVGSDVTVDEINSGSANAGAVITADGSGGTSWESIPDTVPTITLTQSQIVNQDPIQIELTAEQTAIWDEQIASGKPLYFDLSDFNEPNAYCLFGAGADGFYCENYDGSKILTLFNISGTTQKTIGVNIANQKAYPIYPEVYIELSQVTSADPLTVQLTNEQYAIFENNKQVMVDMTALDPTLPIVVWNYAGDNGGYIYYGLVETSASNNYYQIEIRTTDKQATYLTGMKEVLSDDIVFGNANVGDLLACGTEGRGIVTRNLPILTTAPISANTEGGIIIVVLSSEPATYYDGYLYLIQDSQV